MTPTHLEQIGRALYGERWQSPLARDLDVSDRTVRRWMAGEWPIPEGIASDLDRLLRERHRLIGRLLAA
jgi:hypothetical protein